MSPRRALTAAALLLGMGAAPLLPRAQPLAAQGPATVDPNAVDAEVARLTADQQRLAQESSALTPRREALRQRARQEIRWLHHLAQGDALAAHGGPEMLLDHAARAARVRRVVDNTLVALQSAEVRAAAITDEQSRVGGLLAAAQSRREQVARAQRSARETAVADPMVTVYGGAPTAGTGIETFATSAGRLLFPVAGRAEVRRAWRDGADGPGVEIGAPVGTPVRAVFGGRVAFADRYGSYGLIVIVDHGDHYYSVCASLGRVAVRVGQELEQGAVVGVVGDEGGNAGLYFEVRHQGSTLDPVPWLGL